MSAEENKNNLPEGDDKGFGIGGLEELMNAFGGYSEDIQDSKAGDWEAEIESAPEEGVSPDLEVSGEARPDNDGISSDLDLYVPEEPTENSEKNESDSRKKRKKRKQGEKSDSADKSCAASVKSGDDEDRVRTISEIVITETEEDHAAENGNGTEEESSVKAAMPVEAKKKNKKSREKNAEAAKKADEAVKKSDRKKNKNASTLAEASMDKNAGISVKHLHKKNSGINDDSSDIKNPSPVRIAAVLTAICASVALLLAVVNHLTADKIAENTELAMLDSIKEIFDDSVEAERISAPEDSGFTFVYLVKKDGGICGYCAAVAPAGFGGPINLMVGVDSAGAAVGVSVVSMSETPGLGSKTGNNSFLSQFIGKSGSVSVGTDVDAVSGATISSKAVTAGVNSVISNLLDLEALAAERGLSVIPYVPGGAVMESETSDITVQETDAPVTTAADTEPPSTTGVPVAPSVSKDDVPPEIIVENPNNENPGIYAEYEEDTIEYEVITTEHETTEPESTEEVSEG